MPSQLHGTLQVHIYGIDRLRFGWVGFNLCKDKNAGAQGVGKRFLLNIKRMMSCQPKIAGLNLYATVDLDKARVGRTRMIEKQFSSPQWNESFHIYCAHFISNIIFTIKDDNPISATLIGRAHLPVENVLMGGIVDTWVDIVDEEGDPIHGGSRIRVKVQFFDATRDFHWGKGIRSEEYEGVPRTFFQQKKGCKVTLYQDAHVLDSFSPPYLSDGRNEPPRCWEDIFDAITNARHFIYIAGWSVYTEITLIREPQRSKAGSDLTLGKLLKKKADEGVTVLMLVWDDRTSVKTLKEDGLMATHDQDTAGFFQDSKVHCVLCPRNPDGGRSIIQGFEVSTMFTHHQKLVVVDAEIPYGDPQKRRIMSFIGGIDLCDGRYDTQDHPLFSTLNNVHQNDFHQPNFPGASVEKGGPREPWHDIHCRLEGPVAWDVLENFEQRWRKQVGNEYLFPTDRFLVPPMPITTHDDHETWNVQLFRSIDGGAAADFPEDPDNAAALGLVTGKDNVIDRSIQDAYINAIRRAKNFIYIENQYFLGSSFSWRNYNDIPVNDINALHLIPKELSLKIVSKIEAGERFTVYIVIPMWPEGIPESESVQAILDWQKRTMEMMYADICLALQRKRLKADPRDYLAFFCLGSRESKRIGEYAPKQRPEPNSDYSRAQQARRFMIYVHAKMMIVDDEYIIVGSANINQRSMDGARDSEIAMGAYQPKHLGASQPPRGQIFIFRMNLWYEHLGVVDESFNNPENRQCIRKVNEIANRNWISYTNDAYIEDLRVHLLRYPIEVDRDGSIKSLPKFEHFPDTKAPVLGKKSERLPPILTT